MEAPLPLPSFGLTALAPVALMDPAIAWLLDRLATASCPDPGGRAA